MIIVSGFGRCGSSLLMQMLKAGGITVHGAPPLYEDPRGNPAGFDPDFISTQDHTQAIKVLDIYRPELHLPEGEYKVIWLSRNAEQQAKSWVKFAKAVRGEDTDPATLIASFNAHYVEAIKECSRLDPLFIEMWFEDLIRFPAESAKTLAEYVWGDAEKMASVVWERGTDSLPELREFRETRTY